MSCGHLLGYLESSQQSFLRGQADSFFHRTNLLCYCFMKYWPGLNNLADREMLVGGADALSREAMNMVSGSSSQGRALLGDRGNDEAGEIVDAGSEAA
jgi:hypothetical protein